MPQLYHNDIYKFEKPIKSYWEETCVNLKKPFKTINSDFNTNIVIIGAGYTGLSCAIHLAKKYNEDVTLLEAGHIGWGSSARNAGFCCIPPTKLSTSKIIKNYGIKEAKKFYSNTIDGSNFTKSLIEENKIDCDLTGDRNFEIAHHPKSFKDLKEEASIYQNEFNIETEIYSKKEFEEIGHSGQEQFGAFSYKPGFAINPLKFVLGLAKLAIKSGVKIYENNPVIKIEKKENRYKVITKEGSIKAKKIVIATNGFYKDDLVPQLNDRILPAISNIIVTRPLTQEEINAHGFKTHNPILNSRKLLYYYRLLKDNRFLFGARGDLIGSDESSLRMANKMEKQMKFIFPHWFNVNIDYSWRGLVAMTNKLSPSIGKIEGDEIYYSFGYHANGVNTAPWAGKELANLMVGSNSKQLQISKLYLGLPSKFILPSMRLLYLKIAYFYYSLIDR
tara:strand:- start:526 stop:1866 length:1341 start_codon:yes stop_codon:yes gene_type:complete